MTADRELATVLAELLAPTIAEAVRLEVRTVLEAQARPAPEALLSVAECAELAAVHGETIRRAIKAGRLPAVTSLGRHPRVRREDLERFLQPDAAPLERGQRRGRA